MSSGIFPLKELNTWEASAVKSYPLLKKFIHEVYREFNRFWDHVFGFWSIYTQLASLGGL